MVGVGEQELSLLLYWLHLDDLGVNSHKKLRLNLNELFETRYMEMIRSVEWPDFTECHQF